MKRFQAMSLGFSEGVRGVWSTNECGYIYTIDPRYATHCVDIEQQVDPISTNSSDQVQQYRTPNAVQWLKKRFLTGLQVRLGAYEGKSHVRAQPLTLRPKSFTLHLHVWPPLGPVCILSFNLVPRGSRRIKRYHARIFKSMTNHLLPFANYPIESNLPR